MNRRTVLIVDDDAPTRAAYAAFLTECGYDVLEAVHGGEAILHVHRHRPDVVLMDVTMPVLDGVETAEALRKCAPSANTRILAVTGASAVLVLMPRRASACTRHRADVPRVTSGRRPCSFRHRRPRRGHRAW